MEKDGTEYRRQILKMDLLRAIDDVGISERNKELIQRYVQGENYTALAQAYNISKSRVPQLVGRYVQLSKWYLIRTKAKAGHPLEELGQKYEESAQWIESSLLWDEWNEKMRSNRLRNTRKPKK